MKRLLSILTLVCAAASAQTKGGPALTGNTDNGKRLFLKNGCYQCHGQAGQGGLAGARLAQIKLAQPAFIAYVRNPAPGGMPPYRPKERRNVCESRFSLALCSLFYFSMFLL